MATYDRPPTLKDLAAEAQGIIDGLKQLEPISPVAKDLSRQAAEVLANIELHTRAQRALYDAFGQAADAGSQATGEMKNADSPGVSTAFFQMGQALQRLADRLQERMRHEATREPGDFR